MKYIFHIPPDEQKHFELCPECGEYFDCRDLQQVFDHLHSDGSLWADYSSSISLDEPHVEYLNGKTKIDLS